MSDSDPGRRHVDIRAQRNVNIEGDVIGRDQITYGYSAEQVGVLLASLTAEYQPRPFDGRCPYPGLAPFREADAALFFGRERIVQQLVEHLADGPATFVIGPSGSGKSSLAQAGLFASLKRNALRDSSDWRYATLSPGRSPLLALSRALPILTGSLESGQDLLDHAPNDPSRLARWLQSSLQSSTNARAVLMVDPLEEVFTQTTDELERLAFLSQLSNAVAQAADGFRLILVMRSDFVGACARYPAINDLLRTGLTQVGGLNPEELVRAVALPAMRVGLRIDPDLVTTILADVRDEPGVLPLLQFALRDLFEAERGPDGVPSLTLDGYWRRGGLRQALRRHADQVYASLTSDEQSMARDVFRALVSLGQADNAPIARRTARLMELPGSPHAVAAVVERLAQGRLLTLDSAPSASGVESSAEGARTVTLTHDALLEAWPLLADWIAEGREKIRLRASIVDDALLWERHDHDPSYLYAGVRLSRMVDAVGGQAVQLPSFAGEFLEHAQQREAALALASETSRQAELERERRIATQLRARNRWITAVSLVAVTLAIIALIAGAAANQNAQAAASAVMTAQVANTQTVEQYRETLVRSAIIQARQLSVAGNEIDGIRLAAEAVRVGRLQHPQGIPEANAMLTALLQESLDLQRYLGFGQTPVGTADWPDSMRQLDSTHVVFDAAASDRTFVWTTGSSEPTPLMVPGQDGILVVRGAGPEAFWAIDGSTPEYTKYGYDGRIETHVARPIEGAFDIAPNGAYFLASDTKTLSLWAANGEKVTDLSTGTQQKVVDVWFSPDSERFMLLFEDSVVMLFDSNGDQLSRFVTVGHRLDGFWAVDAELSRIAIGESSTVKIWRSDGLLLGTLPLNTNSGFVDGWISAMALSPDGTLVAVANLKSAIGLWQIDGTQVALLQPPQPAKFFELVLLDGGSRTYEGVVVLARSNHGVVWQATVPPSLDAALEDADSFSMGRLESDGCLRYFGGPCQP